MRTNLKRRLGPTRPAAPPPLRSQTDGELMRLARAGHDPAFEAIFERFRKPLLGYSRRIVAAEDAEDVVQRTFIAAHRAIRDSKDELKLRPWLYRVAHNAAIDALRKQGPGHVQLDESLDGVERPDQAFERGQRVRDTVAAIQGLPKRQRRALVLHALEGRPYAEVASELGTNAVAARQLVYEARRRRGFSVE